ncbi:MAG: hypothetical protein Q7T55_03555 [Solirubrobacteraceae bacterium]|nr:hypothetical protein [Solirubrobacteraceae bacterium]
MRFSEQQLSAFGVALNEATLLAVEVNPELRRAVVTIEPPVAGTDLAIDGRLIDDADDRRVQLVLEPVGRVAASLRHGHWDDPRALEEPLELEQLEEVVADFDGAPIYGWEFIDVDDEEGCDRWNDRLSFDWSTGDDGTDHTLDLSQAHGITRHLDLRLWFDVLTIVGSDEREIPLKTFLAGKTDEPGT